MRREVITIDGPVGAGKSTVARMLARKLGYLYLDTGAMYRAIGWKAHRLGIPPEEGPALRAMLAETRLEVHPGKDLPRRQAGEMRVFVDGEEVTEAIRTPLMSLMASAVSRAPSVREHLVALQRTLAENGGVVLEGRDTGTVVCPEARWKFYLDASLEERGRRRHEELRGQQEAVTPEETLAEIRQRDYNDTHRAHSPLRRADEAVLIDTSGITPAEVVRRMLEIISRSGRIGREGLLYRISYPLLYLLCRILFRLQVAGRERIPVGEGAILAANHVSYLDPPLIAVAVGRAISSVARHGLFDVPVLGRVIRWYGAFPVHQEAIDIGAVKESLKRLKQGELLLIFPEGERSADGRMRPPMPGVAMLALQAGVKVVPTLIEGAEQALPVGAKWIRLRPIKVTFGAPLKFSPPVMGKRNKEFYQSVSQRIMEEIARLKEAEQGNAPGKAALIS
ncbi:MAG: (d)CMP kinase [Nitrospirae bacterium]|nr:(d)CMP kinase [Nitrospirota bacterium]